MCPSEVYVIVLRMGFFTYLTRRCKVFCLMHIGLAHCALRWAKCFADLLLARGEPSKHNVFPIQKAVVARQGKRQIRRSVCHNSSCSNYCPTSNSSETEMARMEAFRHTTLAPCLKLSPIFFAGNRSCNVIFPHCNMMNIFILQLVRGY